MALELEMTHATTWGETRELERRLLDAAEALLAHHGSRFALVPFPGRLPARCVAIGDLARIRDMLKPAAAS
jgi:hypothetical protein